VKELNLKYVVITSVCRDDLKDGGVQSFVETVDQIRSISPETKIELLIPDFLNRRESICRIIEKEVEVLGHNIETTRRLFPKIRPQGNYQRSLNVLRSIRELDSNVLLKSSFMVGLGETRDDIVALMKDLVDCGCDILSVGQYLRPRKLTRHIQEDKFYTPEEFEEYKELAYDLGFQHVVSSPLARSSFMAEDSFIHCARRSLKV